LKTKCLEDTLYNIYYLLFNKESPYTELVNEFLFTLYTHLILTDIYQLVPYYFNEYISPIASIKITATWGFLIMSYSY